MHCCETSCGHKKMILGGHRKSWIIFRENNVGLGTLPFTDGGDRGRPTMYVIDRQ